MPNLLALKNNVVISKIFNVDADSIALNDEAEVGDIYDPQTGTFSKPIVELPAPQPLNELGE